MWEGLATRHLQLARETGALTELPFALNALSAAYTFAGEPAKAASLIDPNGGLVELIVAAFRSGKTDGAADALHRLSAMTHASGTDWALGIEARSRARLSDGDTAERLYLEAIGRLGRIRIRVELARAISSVANGCAASAGGWMPASSCVLPTRCLRGSVPRPSQIAPHLSCWHRGARPQTHRGNPGRPDPAGGSDHAAARSSPNPRSARGCSSACAPSNTTSTRSSSSELDRQLGGAASDHAEPRSRSHGQDGDRGLGTSPGLRLRSLGERHCVRRRDRRLEARRKRREEPGSADNHVEDERGGAV
jgi:hypothetical protein